MNLRMAEKAVATYDLLPKVYGLFYSTVAYIPQSNRSIAYRRLIENLISVLPTGSKIPQYSQLLYQLSFAVNCYDFKLITAETICTLQSVAYRAIHINYIMR